ncbi:MAG: DsbA family protein [Proteobacteria bacterium]|nr:DsbA family protein [Pseudomonadota bacterium]
MLRFLCLALGAALVVASAAPVRAASPANGAAPLTAEQGDEILRELREIRKMLADQKAKPAEPAAPAKVHLADIAPNAIGSPDAPVTLIEFTDYQCPFCKKFHERSWPEIKRRYVDTGKLRLVVRDLPLDFHSSAMPAALAARCAGEQGRFLPVFESLLKAAELTPEVINFVVTASGVQPGPYQACVARPQLKQLVSADAAEAERLGINGTPGFVIAQKQGTQLEGVLVVGAQPTEVFTSRIDALLAAGRPN